MSPQYTSKLAASHVNSGTSIPLDQLNVADVDKPILRLPKLHLELDARLPATCHGGITLLLSVWRRFKVADTIADKVSVLGVSVVLEPKRWISRPATRSSAACS